MLSSYTNGFVINTNIASLLVQRNLETATNDMATYMEHLSTGLRVNRSSDDPAGLALSKSLQAQISSSNVAKNNCQTGISFLQTAEGDLTSIQSNLSTMKNLIVQAKTGTLSQGQRDALNATYQQALSEITRVATSSNFSGIKLLDGSNGTAGKVVLQVDIRATASNQIDISSVLVSSGTIGLGVNGTGVSTVTNATAAETLVNNAYDKITKQIASVGGFVSRLTSNMKRLAVRNENLTAANSVIMDTDVATDTAKLTKAQILQQTSASLLQQANQTASLIFTLIGAN